MGGKQILPVLSGILFLQKSQTTYQNFIEQFKWFGIITHFILIFRDFWLLPHEAEHSDEVNYGSDLILTTV